MMQSRVAPGQQGVRSRRFVGTKPSASASAELRCAADLLPERRLPVRSIDMSVMFEVVSKEEPEIRQVLATGERRREFLHLLVMLLKREERFYRVCLAESKALGSQDLLVPACNCAYFHACYG